MGNWYENPNWWVALGTILLAIVAMFQDRIRSWFWNPKLKCKINLEPPDCHRTRTVTNRQMSVPDTSTFFSYYYRFEIWNDGKVSARNVEVILLEILQKEGNNFKRIHAFTPDNLLWSIIRKDFPPNQFKTHCDYISPKTFKHCNLGHIHDPKFRANLEGENNPELLIKEGDTIFCFDVNFRSTALYYLVPPGEYKITLKIGGENAKTITRKYLLRISGKWFEDEDKMLNDGFFIKSIKN